MMTRFIKYNESGRILFIGEVPNTMLDLQREPATELLVADGNPMTDYIFEGAVTSRPNQATRLAEGVLTGLPQPCVIHINNKPYECKDDHAELEFSLPGTYKVRVEAFPYIDAIFEVVKA